MSKLTVEELKKLAEIAGKDFFISSDNQGVYLNNADH